MPEERFELCIWQCRDCLDEPETELAPQRRARLNQCADGRKAVEPRIERGLQCPWHRGHGQRAGEHVFAICLTQDSAFQHRLRDLFDEERYSVRLHHDLIDKRRRKIPSPGHALDEQRVFTPPQAAQGQRGDVRLAEPRRVEFRSVRHDQQRRKSPDAINDDVEPFPRRRVDPVCVFQHHQQRLLGRKAYEPCDEALEQQFLAPLGADRQRGVTPVCRNGKQVREQLQVPSGAPGRGQQPGELFQFRFVSVPSGKARRVLEMRDDRVQRSLGTMRRAEESKARARFPGESVLKRDQQARLANARLAPYQDDSAFARLCLTPPEEEHFQLFFAPD